MFTVINTLSNILQNIIPGLLKILTTLNIIFYLFYILATSLLVFLHRTRYLVLKIVNTNLFPIVQKLHFTVKTCKFAV